MKSALAKQKVGDEAVRAKTGKAWRQWFRVLDDAGARQLDHRQIVALLGKRFRVKSSWWCQMITVAYEQERGRRRKHESPEGFGISAIKTFALPTLPLYEAWMDEKIRKRWLAGASFSISKATRCGSLRIKWGEGPTRVDVDFYGKGARKTQVTVQHRRLATSGAAARMKSYWKVQLEKLEKALAIES